MAREDQRRGCDMAKHLAVTTDQFLNELASWLNARDPDGGAEIDKCN